MDLKRLSEANSRWTTPHHTTPRLTTDAKVLMSMITQYDRASASGDAGGVVTAMVTVKSASRLDSPFLPVSPRATAARGPRKGGGGGGGGCLR